MYVSIYRSSFFSSLSLSIALITSTWILLLLLLLLLLLVLVSYNTGATACTVQAVAFFYGALINGVAWTMISIDLYLKIIAGTGVMFNSIMLILPSFSSPLSFLNFPYMFLCFLLSSLPSFLPSFLPFLLHLIPVFCFLSSSSHSFLQLIVIITLHYITCYTGIKNTTHHFTYHIVTIYILPAIYTAAVAATGVEFGYTDTSSAICSISSNDYKDVYFLYIPLFVLNVIGLITGKRRRYS